MTESFTQPPETLKSGNVGTMLRLREMACLCIFLQLGTAVVYLSCSLLFPKSNFLSVACGTLAIFISLTPLFYAFYTKHFLVLFSCISTFNIAPIWFLYKDTVLPGTDTYIYSSPDLKMEAIFFVSLFQFLVNFLYAVYSNKVSEYSIKSFSFLNQIRLSPQFYIRLTIFTFIFPLVAFYLFYDSIDTLWLAATAGRSGGGSAGGLLIQDSMGKLSSLMIPINSFWQLTPLFGSIAFISSKKRFAFYPLLSLLLGLTVIFVFFLGGSRGTMMFVAGPVLFFLFYYNWNRGLKFWIPAIILFFLSVGIMELQVRFRGNLLSVILDPSKAARAEGLSSITTLNPTEAQQENNMYLFCLMIKGHPAKYPYKGFNDFFATLVNPVPRAIWPGKPILDGAKNITYQPQYILDGPILMGTTNLTFSVVGEAYLAAGILGIMTYSIIYSFFLIFIDGIVYYTKQKQVLTIGLLGLGVYLAFWGYRGFFALISFMYPLILSIFLFQLIGLFKKLNHKNLR